MVAVGRGSRRAVIDQDGTLAKSPAFVSYAREDSDFTMRLVADLKAREANVWLDQLDIRPGRQWDNEVEEALTECGALLVILSPTSVDSRNVMDEVGFALEEGKTVIPVIYRDCRVPFRLRRVQYIDFTSDYQAALKKLINSLAQEDLSLAVGAPSSGVQTVWERGREGAEGETASKAAEEEASFKEVGSRSMFGIGRGTLLSFIALGLAFVIASGWYVASRFYKIVPSVPITQHAAEEHSIQTKINPRDNLRYAWIPGGTFTMGCSAGVSQCEDNEKPAHEVKIGHGFWMGETEVTQGAYKAVTKKPNPSNFKGDDLPVNQVTWDEAKLYCGAVGMRLPSEAEWEYAARAGGSAARYGNLDEVAWYHNNSGSKTHPVGAKSHNAWGLYDMLGNVAEWCSDWYGAYSAAAQEDPVGPKSGSTKILRGGSWDYSPRYVRAVVRDSYEPSHRSEDAGFRCLGDLR